MKYYIKIALLLLLLSAFSCQTDDVPKVYAPGSNEYTNQWIYEQMKKYYYWNEGIGKQDDLSQDSKDYFKSLLNPSDRFSYAYNSSMAETLPKSIRSKFGFDISFVMYHEQVYGVVLYVLKDSPAERSGLHRGQLITVIGSVAIDQNNYENLYDSFPSADNMHLQLTEYSEDLGFFDSHEVTLSDSFTFLQPVNHKIITQQNNIVGYVEIPHFDVGISQSLLNVFQDFKNKSVTNVIVDLRYNGGGDVSSAAALSILLAPNIQPNDQFILFKGNKNGGEVKQTFKEALEMNEAQVSYDALRAAHPSIDKVYILCGNHTASASEIIMNNLHPFMTVITIGDKTLGKDVASFAINDDRVTEQSGWVLYPAIYKIYNSNREGNYSEGLMPVIQSDELQKLEIYPLGDIREVLLKQSLNSILGAKLSEESNMNNLILPLERKNADLESEPVIINGGRFVHK